MSDTPEARESSRIAMNCAEFDKNFDAYVDDMLVDTALLAARKHVEACPPCEHAVTRYQQTRCLLSTAVAEVASAVDVSALWDGVDAALSDRPGTVKVSSWDRLVARARAWATETLLPVFSPQGGALVGIGAAAAIAVSFLLPSNPFPTAQSPTQFAKIPSEVSAPVADSQGAVASRQVAARSRDTRGVSAARVRRVSAGPGQAVSTWVQPRTGAQVIWVSDRGSASALVRKADFSR